MLAVEESLISALTCVFAIVQRLSDAVSDSAEAAGNKASGIAGAPKRTYKSILDSLTSVSSHLVLDVSSVSLWVLLS